MFSSVVSHRARLSEPPDYVLLWPNEQLVPPNQQLERTTPSVTVPAFGPLGSAQYQNRSLTSESEFQKRLGARASLPATVIREGVLLHAA